MRVTGARVELWLAGWRNIRPAALARRQMARHFTFAGLSGLLDAERSRWVLWAPVFAGIGIGLYFALPFEHSIALTVAPLLAAAGLRLSVRHGVLTIAMTGALLCAALGFAAGKIRCELMRGSVMPVTKQVWLVHGWVELVEKRPDKGVRITLRVSAIDGLQADDTPLRVRVHSPYDNTGVTAGDALIVKAVLQPPPQPAEPGGYDFARASWFAGVGGVGFCIGRPETDAAPPAMPVWTRVKSAVEHMREDVSTRITSALPGPTGAITDALITGEHEAIPEQMTNLLRDSGLAHILAISGLKLTIVAGSLFGLTRLLLAAFPAVALRWPVKKFASGAGLAGATFYLLISGCGSATTRAYVMIAIGLIAMLLDRPALSMRNLAVAALCLILPQPETLLDPSFQMSFSAVVALMATYEWAREYREPDDRAAYHRRKQRQRLTGWEAIVLWLAGRVAHILRETVAATTIATIAIAPYTVYTFHRVAVYSILANIVAVPLFNVVIMPLVALALAVMPLGLEAWPLHLVAGWVEVLLWIGREVSALPGAVVLVPQMPASALAAMTLGGAWLCIWQQGWRYLGLAGVALGIMIAAHADAADILIGVEGRPIAVRLNDGTLSALTARSGKFELAQWLQADADGRDVKTIQTGAGFRCDSLGCTALVRGRVVAISDTPASLRDDCANAQVVILRYRQPAPCPGPGLIIDIRDLRVGGAHAVRFTDAGAVLENAAGAQGDRPWSHVEPLYARGDALDEFATAGWQHTPATRGGHKHRQRAKASVGTVAAKAGAGTTIAAVDGGAALEAAAIDAAVVGAPAEVVATVPVEATTGLAADGPPAGLARVNAAGRPLAAHAKTRATKPARPSHKRTRTAKSAKAALPQTSTSEVGAVSNQDSAVMPGLGAPSRFGRIPRAVTTEAGASRSTAASRPRQRSREQRLRRSRSIPITQSASGRGR